MKELRIREVTKGFLVTDDKDNYAFSSMSDLSDWLTSEAFEPAWDKAPDGWIEWKGGEPPAIARGTPIVVRHRDGGEHATTMLGVYNRSWSHTRSIADIVAYRVVTP